MKKKRTRKRESKYYSFISPFEIEANVIKYHGHLIMCPSSFRDQDVIVFSFYKDRCSYIYKTVEHYNFKTFIRMPPFYEGHKVRVVAPALRTKEQIEILHIDERYKLLNIPPETYIKG